MLIAETKTVSRPDTSVLFFNDTDNPVLLQIRAEVGYVLIERTANYLKSATPDGKVVSERNITNNGLTQTTVTTFASVEDYSRVDTIMGIAVDHEYGQYTEEVGLTHEWNQYLQTGIDQPFTCTTTYTYTPETSTLYPMFDYFVTIAESSDKLVSLVNTGTQVIAVHKYQNSEDFTDNHWKDFVYIEQLNTGGVTRTITYAIA